MASRKRSREEDLLIKVAEGGPISAKSFLVRTFSSCAEQLPADASEWDVSGLLLDSKPFRRNTVETWLRCAYSSVYGAAELDAADIEQLSTATSLHEVLAFAQAVGSFEGMLKAACSQLHKLKFVVQLSEQTLEVCADAGLYYFPSDSPSQLKYKSLIESPQPIGSPLSSVQQSCELQQQVAKQTGVLLEQAHRLQLQQLVEALHSFVQCNTAGSNALLYGVLGLVLTDQAVQAAVGSSGISKYAYFNCALSRPCGIFGVGLLEPVGPIKAGKNGEQQFEARLLQEFAGVKAGSKVPVEMDLFEGAMGMRLEYEGNSLYVPAHLSIGHAITSQADIDELFQCNLS